MKTILTAPVGGWDEGRRRWIKPALSRLQAGRAENQINGDSDGAGIQS